MKKILVLTDFSDNSRHAAEYAIGAAGFLKAEIILLHIYQVPLLYPEKDCSMTQDDLQKITVKELDLLAGDLAAASGQEVAISTEIRTGSFFVELNFACAHHDPYLVVMGSYGNTASRFLLWGSHTVYAMKHLPYPLLAVPPAAKYSPVQRMCFFFDGNEAAYSIPLDGIAAIVKDLGAELLIAALTDKKEEKQEKLRHVELLGKQFSSLHGQMHLIDAHHRDANILSFCERFDIGLLTIVPGKQSLLDFFYQNNIRQFISHSHIPVLALHKKLFY